MLSRKEKDDALLAAAFAELDAFENATGKVVQVSIETSNAAGNCLPGVVEWRKKWCGGRQVVSAREILSIATQCRDQIPAAIQGVRRAIKDAAQ